MDNIVEQIAREVMLKLKSKAPNRGSSYSPAPSGEARAQVRGRTAVLITPNYKVLNQVLQQVSALVPPDGFLVLSAALAAEIHFKAPAGMEVVSANTVPAPQVLQGVKTLLIPALSTTTMAKAANLMEDSYAGQLISVALCEGISVVVTDEALLDAPRYYPTGVARKLDSFRRDLESMGVRFERGSIQVTPEHKCAVCVAESCSTCSGTCAAVSTARSPEMPPLSSPPPATPSGAAATGTASCANPDECSMTYGSCAAMCSQRVKDVIQAGAERIDKGLEAPLPSRELGRYIDHTLLKPTATAQEITKLCEEARAHLFASVCVNPGHVALAAKLLKGSPVKVCTVIGFPLGATSTFSKVMETRDAIANGAEEIDMVINVGALKAKDYELVKNDISRVVEAANGHTVKVILETSLLNEEEKVKGCELSKLAGADFVKTSTGFSSGGATLEDVCLMRCVVGPHMGVKASGGIRDTKTAQQMIEVGATRIGASASVGIVKGEQASGQGY